MPAAGRSSSEESACSSWPESDIARWMPSPAKACRPAFPASNQRSQARWACWVGSVCSNRSHWAGCEAVSRDSLAAWRQCQPCGKAHRLPRRECAFQRVGGARRQPILSFEVAGMINPRITVSRGAQVTVRLVNDDPSAQERRCSPPSCWFAFFAARGNSSRRGAFGAAARLDAAGYLARREGSADTRPLEPSGGWSNAAESGAWDQTA